MTEELFEKIQNFERKYADILIEWLRLIKENKINHCLSPNNPNDAYGMMLYKKSCECGNKLTSFVKNTDRNILCTYLKYHNSNRERITYPWCFNYHEPEIDLALNP